MLVKNHFPTVSHPTCRLAIVGDAPGLEDTTTQEPFSGPGGRMLRGTLSSLGIAPEQCLLANVCNRRPPENDIANFSWYGPEIQSGLKQLESDLNTYQPTCILALGSSALRYFRPDLVQQRLVKKETVDYVPIGTWRGSIFNSIQGYKVVACYHPSYILRAFTDVAYFYWDVARAVEQSKFPGLRNPVRNGILRPSLGTALEYIAKLHREQTPFAFDIEGYPDHIGVTMISLCPSPTEGIVIPFYINGTHYWTEDEEYHIWTALSELLADPRVKKTCHAGIYESFVLIWKHRCLVAGIHEDTMWKHWELFPELEKNLGVVGSFYTEEPYYKDERKSTDTEIKLNYNFKDSAITKEACNQQETLLLKYPKSYEHYRFNISLLPAIQFLNVRGCRLDQDRLAQHRVSTKAEVNTLTEEINAELGTDFNVKSYPQKQWLLYEKLGYKPSARYGKVTDDGTLLDYYIKHRSPLLKKVIQAVRKRTRASDIEKLVCDYDGRIRTALELVGTNTGRLSSRAAMSMQPTFKKSGELKEWENTGTNLQNVTAELRDVFIPDSDAFDFWQLDLAGADGWTVAADLAALGYPTMLEDYLAGLKPAKVLMLLLLEQEAGRNPALINQLSRQEIKDRCNALVIPAPEERDSQGRPGDWKYLACKKTQHGTNYDAKPETIALLTFEDSDGLVDLTIAQAAIYQYLYKLRYKPEERNNDIKRQLIDRGYLQAACGIRRKFFGIRNRRDPDNSIIREASAFEPQANTTWATNMTLNKLWYDPNNRTSASWLHCECLLQIHDALAGQYHKSIREWAHERMRSYFNNPLLIHGIPITIPADGGYGTSWRDTKVNKVK